MISIKSDREIEIMRQAGYINYLTHEELKKHLRPGITTNELNDIADKFIRSHGGKPSCLGYEGYPNWFLGIFGYGMSIALIIIAGVLSLFKW